MSIPEIRYSISEGKLIRHVTTCPYCGGPVDDVVTVGRGYVTEKNEGGWLEVRGGLAALIAHPCGCTLSYNRDFASSDLCIPDVMLDWTPDPVPFPTPRRERMIGEL